MTVRAPILASYWYWKRADLNAPITAARRRGITVDLFADSGAFSADNSGARITVKEYATWLMVNAPLVNFAASLDVIGDPDATVRNTDRLQDMVGDQVIIVPAFHVGSPWPALEAMCARYRFIALGGAVRWGGKPKVLLPWLVKAHRIAAEHGTVMHGFGLTRPPYPSKLPWYSVDSSYWNMATRNGTLALFEDRTQTFTKVRVGTDDPLKQARLVRSYGMDPRTAATTGFGRATLRGDAGRGEYRWLMEASVESWLRYADRLAAARTVPAAPGVSGDGTKLYLAAGSIDHITFLIDCHARHDRTAPAPASTPQGATA